VLTVGHAKVGENAAVSPRIRLVLDALAGFALSFAIVEGFRISVAGGTGVFGIRSFAAFVALGALLGAGLCWLGGFLDAHPLRPAQPLTRAQRRRHAWIAFAVILVGWFPVFLAAFPGFFDYDAGVDYLMQWGQIESGQLNSHHPILHTLYLEATVEAGQALFGSFNAGVAVSVGIQALLVAAALAAVLRWLLSVGMGRVGFWASVAYLALDPIVACFAFATTKDVMFSACVVLWCALLGQLYRLTASGAKADWRHLAQVAIGIALLGFFIGALRSNALVAFAIIVPVLLVVVRGHGRVVLLASMAVAVVFVCIVLGPVSSALNVEKSPIGKWNALSVPIQQIARCSVDPSVSEEDKAAIDEVAPGMVYGDGLSDYARSAWGEDEPEKIDAFLSLYRHLGRAYPAVYFDAFLYQTQDAWSPFSIIDEGNYDGEPGATSIFEATQKPPATPDSKFPALLDALRTIGYTDALARVPVAGMIVSVWPYLFALGLALVRALVRRDRCALVVLVPLAVIALSVLFGPAVLIRYYLYLFFGLPLIVWLSVRPLPARQAEGGGAPGRVAARAKEGSSRARA
jgi:nitrate reductase NapE component